MIYEGNGIHCVLDESEDGKEAAALLVEGLSTISEKSLRSYFGNRRKSGGAEITSLTLYADKQLAIIHFKDESGNKKVSSANIFKLSGFIPPTPHQQYFIYVKYLSAMNVIACCYFTFICAHCLHIFKGSAWTETGTSS